MCSYTPTVNSFEIRQITTPISNKNNSKQSTADKLDYLGAHMPLFRILDYKKIIHKIHNKNLENMTKYIF